jgi:ligand-binding sensor domain-containing protein
MRYRFKICDFFLQFSIFVFCFLVISKTAFAQSQKLRWKNLTSEDGLSVNTVNCIVQDNSGFMWIGTQSGLDKYDGVKFTSYRQNPGDSNGLNNSYINCIVKDSKGYLWIGTEAGGVNKYNPYLDKFTYYTKDQLDRSSAINNNKVNALAFESDTVLWMATEDGICKLNTVTNKTTSLKNTKNKIGLLGGKQINALLFDSGILWIGTNGEGLYSLDTKNFVFTANPYNDQGLILEGKGGEGQSKNIIKIFKRNNNELWLGTNGLGILHYNIKTKKVFYQKTFQDGYHYQNKIKDIQFDPNGTVWVGTFEGLFNLDEKGNLVIDYKAESKTMGSLSDDKIQQIYIDNKRNFWLANYSKGINVSITGLIKFQHFKQDETKKNWLPNSVIYSLFEDKQSQLWVGTEDAGIFKYDKYLDEFVDQNFILAKATNKSVYSIFQDKNESMWLGTDGSGLYKYNSITNKTELVKKPEENFDNATILAITQTSDGLIWIATFGDGLFSVNPDNISDIKQYNEKSGLSTNEI